MIRPGFELAKDNIDHILEIIAVFGLVVLTILPIIYFNKLPERIPIHFGFNGEPDGFGSKIFILVIPFVGILLFTMMLWINKYPHTFNYLPKITNENAHQQYRLATKLIRVLNALITCMFAYITHTIIQTALGNKNGFSSSFIVIFVILIFAIIGFYIYQSAKGK